MKILLVDDEEEFVSTLAERLAIRGVDADWVMSGYEALDKAERENYDLMVVDIKMPGIGGLEVIKRISAKKPETKFVVLSGHGEATAWSDNDLAGKCYRLIKPTDIEVLLELIQRIRSV